MQTIRRRRTYAEIQRALARAGNSRLLRAVALHAQEVTRVPLDEAADRAWLADLADRFGRVGAGKVEVVVTLPRGRVLVASADLGGRS